MILKCRKTMRRNVEYLVRKLHRVDGIEKKNVSNITHYLVQLSREYVVRRKSATKMKMTKTRLRGVFLIS